MKLWLNGDLVDADKARIAPNDRGFLLGDGLFETMLAERGEVIGFQSHMNRLRAGAKTLELPLDQDGQQIADGAKNLLVENELQTQRASLRLTVSRGPGTRGLAFPSRTEPTWVMTAAPQTPPAAQMSAIVSKIRRNDLSPLSAIKTLNYLDNILARREAASAGAEEALLLNTKERLACASAANLFIVEGNTIVTPPVSEGALPGITRAMVIDLAGREQIKCAEEPIEHQRLLSADEIFLTNSLIGLCPISDLSGQTFRQRQMTQHLRSFYEEELRQSSDTSLTGR